MLTYVFPSESDKKVQVRAKDLRELTEALGRWTDDCYLPPNEKNKFLRRLAKRRKAVASIEKVSLHPMTVGVFGPSQSGKSYLVNELTKGSDQPLEILLGDLGKRDFLGDLNPEGGQESTAQVTRFTCCRENLLDGAYPVHIRLLSRTDLVAIFVNGYTYECKRGTKIDSEEIDRFLTLCRAKPDEGNNFLSADYVFEIENYISSELDSEHFTSLSEVGYWEFFRDVVTKKGFQVQVQYLSWLWGRIESMTNLFLRLAQTVHGLNQEDLWVQADSLLPRYDSILDVQNLKRNLRSGGDDMVRVMNSSRKTGAIPKSLLSALTAELILSVPQDSVIDFMQYCDVLDFPGARERGGSFVGEDLDHQPEFEGDVDLLAEVFLRGKIGYLFDRYVELRDVNSLVLCCPPGNPTALSLPHLVNKWIRHTHGPAPADRHDRPVMLYVAFTKFDDTLTRKDGSKDPASPVIWESRLKTGFEDFFGRLGKNTENWTTKWDRRRQFINCYWVRNPNVGSAVFKRIGGVEEVSEDHQPWLVELEPHYLDNSLVKNHFSDPEKSWFEVTSPGRNGIQLLKDRLGLGLLPEHKSQMLTHDLDRIFQAVETICAPLFLDDDTVEKAKKEAELRIQQMDEQEYEGPVFGNILQRFLLKESQIELLYEEAYKVGPVRSTQVENDLGTAPESSPEAASEAPIRRRRAVRVRPSGGGEPNGTEAPQQVQPPRPVPEAQRFSDLVMQKWESTLANLENDHNLLNATGLHADWFRSVTDIIVKASYAANGSGMSLPAMIAQSSSSAFRTPDPGSHKKAQAFLTAQLIGNWVSFLGEEPPSQPEIGSASPVVSGEGFPGEPFLAEWLQRLEKIYVAQAGVATDSQKALQASKDLRALLEGCQAKLW